jgi:small GTP-binding protein
MSTLIRPAFVRRGNISSHHQVRAITRNNKSIGHYWKQFHSSSSKYATVSSALDGLYSLLNYKERQLLTEQRQLTETARQLAGQVGGSAVSELLHNTASLNFLQELRLQSTFSVVIAGEFNAGKSTLINALLGNQLLESGALPTTDTIHIVANAREHQEAEKNDDDQLLENNNNKNSKQDTNSLPLGVTLHLVPDMPLLQDVTLIDTPGTNSAWMDHTARTFRLLPSADLILFVTSADRPFSESERSLMKSIQAYRKSIVVLINKMDILDDTPDAKTKIIDFVTDHASELLGARPIVIPISSRTALSAKLQMKTTDDSENNNEDPTGLWNASNFASLESFLRDSLTTQTRIRSKLTSPIGVAEGLMVQCLETLKQEKEVLQADISTLNILKSQLEGWQKELNADLNTTKTTMTSMIQKEGERFEMLLSRMNLFNFYMWTLPGNPKHFNAEWQETKRQASLHRQKDLEAELLEQVYETAYVSLKLADKCISCSHTKIFLFLYASICMFSL